VGNLIVAVGLGGKLMRTVSFLGCTFAGSGGFGGTGPPGGFGMFSGIKLIQWFQAKVDLRQCQTEKATRKALTRVFKAVHPRGRRNAPSRGCSSLSSLPGALPPSLSKRSPLGRTERS
jgi:hypothetical protein